MHHKVLANTQFCGKQTLIHLFGEFFYKFFFKCIEFAENIHEQDSVLLLRYWAKDQEVKTP